MRRKICVYIALLLVMTLVMPVTQVWAISWSTDLKGSLKEAGQRQMPLMIDFYTKWCNWCKELDRKTYSDNKVNELSTNFICVKVDAEKDTAIAGKYNVRGYPTAVFLNKDGSVNSRVIGYRPPESFIRSMEAALKNSGVAQKNAYLVKNEGLELSGIIFDREKVPVAIINNIFVKKGDLIGKGKVSKITKDRVDVLFADKTVTLTID